MAADNAAYRWEFACGHVTEGGNECADACSECGERDLRRKTPVAAKRHRSTSKHYFFGKRSIARDAARIAWRNGERRLALAVLLWPPGWSHTRIEANRGA